MVFTSSSRTMIKCLGFSYPVGDQSAFDHERVASIPCDQRNRCRLFKVFYPDATTFLFPLTLYPNCSYYQECPHE